MASSRPNSTMADAPQTAWRCRPAQAAARLSASRCGQASQERMRGSGSNTNPPAESRQVSCTAPRLRPSTQKAQQLEPTSLPTQSCMMPDTPLGNSHNLSVDCWESSSTSGRPPRSNAPLMPAPPPTTASVIAAASVAAANVQQ